MSQETKYKYPRTPHLPWSRGRTADDLVLRGFDLFEDKEVVITEKMDGENTSLYSNCLHARSLDSRHHPSRNWVKRLHAVVRHEIPAGWRVCGENLFAEHSIRYTELLSYFYLFSVWNEKNETLSWDETVAFAEKMRLPTPQELYRGVWDAKLARDLSFDRSSVEGYVVRLAGRFSYPDFSQSVAKNVRYAHVNTDEHWMHQDIKQNLLRANSQYWVNL